jgi:hypothetical protein
LWQEGVCCAQARLRHGLRQVRLSVQGVRLNGRVVVLRGTTELPRSDDEARALHARGFNLVLAPAREIDAAARLRAEQHGYFLLSRDPVQAGTLLWGPPAVLVECLPPAPPDRVGAEWDARSGATLPSRASFLLCEEQALPALAQLPLPKFVWVECASPRPAPAPPGVIGWIERPKIPLAR